VSLEQPLLLKPPYYAMLEEVKDRAAQFYSLIEEDGTFYLWTRSTRWGGDKGG
jgi:hypothetical protein